MPAPPHGRTIDAPPGSRRELLRVALPLVISSGSISLMYVVDRVLLTWYSLDSMAACLPASLLHWTLLSIALGTVTYVNTFVAQYQGAGQPERVGAAIWQAVHVALVSGLAMILFVPWADVVFSSLGHEPAVRELEVQYFQVLCLGTVALLLQAAFGCFFSGLGQTRLLMWVNLASTLVNFLLDVVLIFGWGPFPELGIRGAALATVAANIFSAVVLLICMLRSPRAAEYGLNRWLMLDVPLLRRLLRFGFPSGLHVFVDVISYTLFIHLVGMMGREHLTATNLAFNLNSLTFVPMLGVGTAISTLVGQRLGEGRPDLAQRTSWTGFQITSCYMLVFAVLYVLLPEVLLWPYHWGHDAAELAALKDQVVVLLRFVAVYSLFDGMAIVFSAALRGAGDTRFALVFTALAGWMFLVIPTCAAWRYAADPLFWSWTACTVFVIVLGMGFWWRFAQGHWQHLRVIEHDWLPEAEPAPVGMALCEAEAS